MSSYLCRPYFSSPLRRIIRHCGHGHQSDSGSSSISFRPLSSKQCLASAAPAERRLLAGPSPRQRNRLALAGTVSAERRHPAGLSLREWASQPLRSNTPASQRWPPGRRRCAGAFPTVALLIRQAGSCAARRHSSVAGWIGCADKRYQALLSLSTCAFPGLLPCRERLFM